MTPIYRAVVHTPGAQVLDGSGPPHHGDRMDHLLRAQAGTISRAQLLQLDAGTSEIRRLLRRRDLTVVHPGVYVNHTGPLTWLQRAWAGVLHAWPAALCDESALRADRGPGHRSSDERTIHVAVERDRKILAPPNVVVHRLVRLDERVRWNLGPPRLRFEDAALDVALRLPAELDAIAVLAAACGTRRTTASRLLTTLDDRTRAPRRAWIEAVLRDVAHGTASVLEHGYLTHVERAHVLPPARRQLKVTGGAGSIYRDAEYLDRLVVELDGRLFHGSVDARDADLERDLDAALDGRTTVRLGWGQVFERPCSTARKLGRLLQAPVRPCARCAGAMMPS